MCRHYSSRGSFVGMWTQVTGEVNIAIERVPNILYRMAFLCQ
jgi:hypothetical protein